MKWKKLLSKQNARHYAWPAGWDPAEAIAEQLECSPERVREHLAPSIKAGEVEVKVFTVWDEETGRKMQKTGFRIAGTGKPEAEPLTSRSSTKKDRWPFWEGATIKRLDSPNLGVVKGNSIHWENGQITTPTSKSTTHKLRLAGKK